MLSLESLGVREFLVVNRYRETYVALWIMSRSENWIVIIAGSLHGKDIVRPLTRQDEISKWRMVCGVPDGRKCETTITDMAEAQQVCAVRRWRCEV
jgi:hypothetical protein